MGSLLGAYGRLIKSCSWVDENEKISTRQNKEQGQSKKQAKDAAFTELEETAQEKDLIGGRWQMTVYQPFVVDRLFCELSHSLAAR